MVTKRKAAKAEKHFCRECALAVFDQKFENLSLEGKPTLLSCPQSKPWKRVVSEEACAKFKPRL